MRFNDDKTFISPDEVIFLNNSCMGYPEGSPPDILKLKVIAGFLDWLSSIGMLTTTYEGIGRLGVLMAIASTRVVAEEEPISLELTTDDLRTARDMSIVSVIATKEAASNVGVNLVISKAIIDEMYPDEADETRLTEFNEESIKGLFFERDLRTIDIGTGLIDAIAARLDA